MSKVDVAKENIAYLKGWLNVLLAIVFPLMGWFVTTVGSVSIFLSAAAVVVLLIGALLIMRLHKTIERSIKRLEKL
jgi:hypothetical protein